MNELLHGIGQDFYRAAAAYYPAELRPVLTDYVSAIRDSHNAGNSDAQRAESFMKAARIAHDQGMELLGTELGPDFHCYAGRFGADSQPANWIDNTQKRTITAPSSEAIARYDANAPADNRRFHYRYIAAEHAWSASQLMPDGAEETAAVLYEAGCWLKDRDPEAANRFYVALVQRCPSTELGKQAAIAHWFPKPAPAASTSQ